MRIGILGTFVWDTIHHPASPGAPVEQWGGLVYSLSGFAGAAEPGSTLVPIARVGRDLAPLAFAFLSSLPAPIDPRGIMVVPEPNNRVELRYRDLHERQERLTGGVSPWTWPELKPLLESVDVAYVNFLSGMELSIDVAEELEGAGIPLYADLHSLFLGPPGDGARKPRRLPEAERWLRCFDAVQMNDTELGLLGDWPSDPVETLSRIPLLGPELALVTKGEAGAAFATSGRDAGVFEWPGRRAERFRGGVSEGREDPPAVIEVPLAGAPVLGDPTGCGDVWGSVVFAGLCAGMDIADSIARGHAAAAAKMAEPRIENLASRIREAVS